jgi:WXG100 family type VII secretion target
VGSDQRSVVRLPVRKEDVARLDPNGYSRAEIARLLDAAEPDQLLAAAATWHATSRTLAGLHDDLRSKAETIAVDWDGSAAATCQQALRKIAGTARQLSRYAADLHEALSTAAHAQQRAKDQLAEFRTRPTMAAGLDIGGDGNRLLEHLPDAALAAQIDHTARQWLQGVYDGYHRAMASLPEQVAYNLPRLSTGASGGGGDVAAAHHPGSDNGSGPRSAVMPQHHAQPVSAGHDGPLSSYGGGSGYGDPLGAGQHTGGQGHGAGDHVAGGAGAGERHPGAIPVGASGGLGGGAEHHPHAPGVAAGAGLAAAGHLASEAGLAAEARQHGAAAGHAGSGQPETDRETGHGYGRQGQPGPWVPPDAVGPMAAGADFDGSIQDIGTSLAGGAAASVPLDPNQPVGTTWQGPAGSEAPYASGTDPDRSTLDPNLPGPPADGPRAPGQADPGVILSTAADAIAAASGQEHHQHQTAEAQGGAVHGGVAQGGTGHSGGSDGGQGSSGPAPAGQPVSQDGGHAGGSTPGLSPTDVAATAAAAVAAAGGHHDLPVAGPTPTDPPSMQGDASGTGQPAAPSPLPDARTPVTVPDDQLPDLHPDREHTQHS